jgi:hypothetical protein
MDMSNLYAKAESKIAELEANIAGYHAAGADEAKGKEMHERVAAIFDRIVEGDKSAFDELAEQGDYIEDPSYRLVSELPELAGLKETLTLPLAMIGSTRYLITDDDKGLISPAGYWDDGIFVKNDVWIETNRLPRYLGPGLCYYEVAKVLDKAA